MQYDDLTLDGHRYDVRVLATPLEYLHFLSATDRRPDTGGPVGMGAVLHQDLEWQVASIAADVHRVVQERLGGDVCACGLVMSGGDVVTSTGHRNLRTWCLAGDPYVVSGGQDDGERFAVVCPSCGLGVATSTLKEAAACRSSHDCSDLGALRTPAELRLHLGLA